MCVLLLFLVLQCSLLRGCGAQNTSGSSDLHYATLTNRSASLITGNLQCNETAYAAFAFVTLVSANSTGTLSWMVAVTATSADGITFAGLPIGPLADGNVTRRDTLSLANRTAVGAQYTLSLSCTNNGTGLQAQCNAYYNLSLQCVQAPASHWLASSSGVGRLDGAPPVLIGAGVWFLVGAVAALSAALGWSAWWRDTSELLDEHSILTVTVAQ